MSNTQTSLTQLRVLNPPPPPPPPARTVHYEVPQVRKIPIWSLAGATFILFALGLLIATRGTDAGSTLGTYFVSIILEALPFVMLGSLLGGLFEVFVSR